MTCRSCRVGAGDNGWGSRVSSLVPDYHAARRFAGSKTLTQPFLILQSHSLYIFAKFFVYKQDSKTPTYTFRTYSNLEGATVRCLAQVFVGGKSLISFTLCSQSSGIIVEYNSEPLVTYSDTLLGNPFGTSHGSRDL